jgi:hypothetical protein
MMVLQVNPMVGGGRLFPDFIGSEKATGTASPLVINRPAGVASGDLMIAVMWENLAATWTGDTGWTEVFDSGTTPSLRVAHKTAGGSEPASYSFAATTGNRFGGFILAYRNAVYDLIGSETRATSATSTAPSVTALKEGRTAIAAFGYSSGATLTTAPAGWTHRADLSDASASGWGYSRNVPVGATGAATLVASASSANSGIQILIRRA